MGDGTLLDVSAHPPLVSRVQYVLDAPTSDDLIESFPVFLVSEALGSALMEAVLEGIGLGEAETLPSEEYTATYGPAPHKRYRWLKVEPSEVGDCWLDESFRLVVSDRMYAVIEQHDVGGCDVTQLM